MPRELKAGGWLDRARANFFAWRAYDLRSHAVVWWHALLCAIAVLNIALWSLAAIAVMHSPALNHTVPDVYIRMQLWLSAGYVLGCAFRSVLPVYDIPRVVLIDTPLSNVIVGRSVATAAELCFAAQWALMLHRMAFMSHSVSGQTISALIVPLIVIAEACSWYAVLTTAQRAHAAENSIWGLSAALVVAGFLMMEPQRVAGLSGPVIVWCVGGAAYVAYIFLFDVPAYWSRWRVDQTTGRRHLSITEGVRDACGRRIVSYRWEVWKNEVLWMSLYFSVGVWSSVSLVYASMRLAG
jgi:hypothetical protein